MEVAKDGINPAWRHYQVNEMDGAVARTYLHVTTGLDHGTTYLVRVRAVSDSGAHSPYSLIGTGTTREAGGASNDIRLSLEYPDGTRVKTAKQGETVTYRIKITGMNDFSALRHGITSVRYRVREQNVHGYLDGGNRGIIRRFVTFTGITEGYVEWAYAIPRGHVGSGGPLEISLEPYRENCDSCTRHPVVESRRTLCLAIEDSGGNVAHPCSSGQVETPEPAQIVRGPTVSEAGADGAWTDGETVSITVGFDGAVDVDTTNGTPAIGIRLGGSAERSAAYTSGSGTSELTFAYAMTKSDGRQTSMLVPADAITLNGGTIRNAGTTVDAALAHNAAAKAGGGGRNRGRGVQEPPELTATFQNVPQTHDGRSEFTVQIHFSEAPELGWETVRGSLLDVSGGTVTKARRTTPGSNQSWEVTVEPGKRQARRSRWCFPVRACGASNAICVSGRALARAACATVSPPPPLTATIAGAPPEHDGSTSFEVEVVFSEAPSDQLRDGARPDVHGKRRLHHGGAAHRAGQQPQVQGDDRADGERAGNACARRSAGLRTARTPSAPQTGEPFRGRSARQCRDRRRCPSPTPG